MKIWYQSSTSYGYEPVWDKYGETLLGHIQRVLRPDTKVHLAGIKVMVRDSRKFKPLAYYQDIQSLNSMYKAQKEGYDAFVVGCTVEPAVEVGKSLLNMPVVGISEASYHMAMTLGRLFAVVTSSPHLCQEYEEQVHKHGISSRYLRGPYYFLAPEEELARALTDPEPVMKKFRAVCEKAVADGASVIIPSPGFLSTLCYKTGVTNIQEALVLDTVSVAVKTAEMLVDLKKIGVKPSRTPGVYSQASPAMLKEYLAKFKSVLTIDY